MGVPGSFPSGSSSHEKAVTLNLHSEAAETQGSKMQDGILFYLWESQAGT